MHATEYQCILYAMPLKYFYRASNIFNGVPRGKISYAVAVPRNEFTQPILSFLSLRQPIHVGFRRVQSLQHVG